jgi:hypothetical protein
VTDLSIESNFEIPHPPAIGQDVDANEMLRFYALAKRAEWQVGDLAWTELAPFPEPPAHLSDVKKDRRNGIWKSVISQQLQADQLAVEMSTQLLRAAEHPAAKQYYTTMVNDEARHTEAWLKLINEAGGPTERDKNLDELVHIVLNADTIEEKIFLMQVFFEKAIIGRFEQIARGAGDTVLGQLCVKLQRDDGIHHSSGMAYERILLAVASKKTKEKVAESAGRALPYFVGHVMWRPPERAMIGSLMRREDLEYASREIDGGLKRAASLGLDFSNIDPKAALNKFS